MQLLPKTHRIIDRPVMEHRPYGKNPQGAMIQDVSGMSIRANIEYLEDVMTRRQGPNLRSRI